MPAVKNGFLNAADGLRLAYQWYEPSYPRAVVVILHGYGDHGARYAELAQRLTARHLAVMAFDYRGHGRAAGQRGYCGQFSEYLSDLESACALAHRKLPGVPVALVGHSHGGLIALRALCDPGHPAYSLPAVLSSPFLKLRKPVPGLKLWLGRVASGVAPRLAMGQGIEATDLTHDPEMIAASRQDRLAHKRATARWFTESAAAQSYVAAQVGRLAAPTLWLVAGADPVADPETTLSVYHRAGGEKQLEIYSDFYHEVFHEVGRQQVFHDVGQWLSSRFS